MTAARSGARHTVHDFQPALLDRDARPRDKDTHRNARRFPEVGACAAYLIRFQHNASSLEKCPSLPDLPTANGRV